MVKTLSYNNRSYKCFFTSGMTRPVITMITANGVTRGVKNPVTIAKVLAAIAEEDHTEALEMNEKFRHLNWLHHIFWFCNNYTERTAIIEAAHAEALVDDANYQGAIKIVADNLTLPVWDGCSETVKREVVKTHHAEALEMNAQRDADNAAGMEKMMKHLKMVAGPVIPAVRARITPETSEEEALAMVHEEILRWSESFANFAKQHLLFNTEQRRKFAGIMYDLLAPVVQNVEVTINPVYEKFAKQTGKSGALNFICHQLSPSPVYSIYQRADGMQLAVNAEGTASFMRPFKQASWLRAGFEANLEYYWLVQKGVTINETPKLTAYYHDGILDTAEAI